VLLIRRIRELLYEQGFTISGARNKLVGPEVSGLALDLEPGVSMDLLAIRSELERVLVLLKA